MKKIILSILAISLLTFSCTSDDDDIQVVEPLGAYENGVLISGEGSGTVSGSVSYLSSDLTTTENQIYFNVNNETLGVYFQSIGFNGNLAYLVLDNGTITIVNRYTFEKENTISSGLNVPRYITFSNGKGYVSNWGDGMDSTDDYIAVVDLATNTVENTISVGEGPEQIVVNGNKLYVSHKGGWGMNNIISVINTNDNTVSTITVNDKPDEMIINDEGDLVVLSEGANLYWQSPPVETSASITKIDMSDDSIISTLTFADGVHPSLMTYNNGTLYYVASDNVYSLTDGASSLPTSSIISLTTGYVYGMAVKNNSLYVTDADFSGLSELLIYDLSTMNQTGTYDVALGASKIYFN